jgi:hypothetical protein
MSLSRLRDDDLPVPNPLDCAGATDLRPRLHFDPRRNPVHYVGEVRLTIFVDCNQVTHVIDDWVLCLVESLPTASRIAPIIPDPKSGKHCGNACD